MAHRDQRPAHLLHRGQRFATPPCNGEVQLQRLSGQRPERHPGPGEQTGRARDDGYAATGTAMN